MVRGTGVEMTKMQDAARVGTQGSRVKILLLEDNPGDVALFETAVKNSDIAVASTGDAALRSLLGGFTPDVVVLDINVPVRTGLEVLAEIKTDATLRLIPVVIFSNSDRPEDIQQAYKLGAAAYIVKPMELEATENALSAFANFWATQVRFPKRSPEHR